MYIFFTKTAVSKGKTAHLSSPFLRFLRNTDIESLDRCLDTALKFLTAKIVYDYSVERYFDFCSDKRLRSYSSNKLKINKVRTELFKGTFFQ